MPASRCIWHRLRNWYTVSSKEHRPSTHSPKPMTTASPPLHQNHIDGAWTSASTGQTFDDINPADAREVVGRFQASSADDARVAVAAAAAAFDGWRKTPVTRRAAMLNAAALYLETHAAKFAEELTREEGKPLAQAKDEFLRSAQTIRFYAVEGQSFSGETFPQDDAAMVVYTQREPKRLVQHLSIPISNPL